LTTVNTCICLFLDTSTPSTVTVDDSTDTELPAKKPNKKGLVVTWAEDSKLASYHFFEMDEEERGILHSNEPFYEVISALYMYICLERESQLIHHPYYSSNMK